MDHSIPISTTIKNVAGLHLADISVLVVDDNHFIRGLIQRLLFAMGFATIIEATNAEEAFGVMKSRTVDLVISDWEMPGQSGLDFLKACREAFGTQTAHTCFVMLTAHSDRDNVIEAKKAGVDGFVVKPIAPQLLYERVFSALASRQQKIDDDDVVFL